MQTEYHFKTEEFGVSDSGVHLLRNGYNYQTIRFSEISRIRIEKGKELHNWFWIFLIGAVLIIGGIYMSVGPLNYLFTHNIGTPRTARVVMLLLLPVLGAYFVYNSFRTGLVMRIDYSNGTRDMFPLSQLVQKGQIKAFRVFLNQKLGAKVLK